MALLIQILVALIIAGVLLWAVQLILSVIPMDDWLKQVATVVLRIVVVLIVVFMVLVPLLQKLPGMVHF